LRHHAFEPGDVGCAQAPGQKNAETGKGKQHQFGDAAGQHPDLFGSLRREAEHAGQNARRRISGLKTRGRHFLDHSKQQGHQTANHCGQDKLDGQKPAERDEAEDRREQGNQAGQPGKRANETPDIAADFLGDCCLLACILPAERSQAEETQKRNHGGQESPNRNRDRQGDIEDLNDCFSRDRQPGNGPAGIGEGCGTVAGGSRDRNQAPIGTPGSKQSPGQTGDQGKQRKSQQKGDREFLERRRYRTGSVKHQVDQHGPDAGRDQIDNHHEQGGHDPPRLARLDLRVARNPFQHITAALDDQKDRTGERHREDDCQGPVDLQFCLFFPVFDPSVQTPQQTRNRYSDIRPESRIEGAVFPLEQAFGKPHPPLLGNGDREVGRLDRDHLRLLHHSAQFGQDLALAFLFEFCGFGLFGAFARRFEFRKPHFDTLNARLELQRNLFGGFGDLKNIGFQGHIIIVTEFVFAEPRRRRGQLFFQRRDLGERLIGLDDREGRSGLRLGVRSRGLACRRFT